MAAEALWEGRPLADLEFEPFARVEVERLEELRLAPSRNGSMPSSRSAGSSRSSPSWRSLAVEHPFRERFRRS